MRFSEKSFEVRFCAALSAAIMPFNRNPQWFGMTQAQERRTGIDTMLEIGGHLLLFQFKAKQNDKFILEALQWNTLAAISRKYPNSTYYVFPEAAGAKSAASVDCILKHSWCCPASDLGKSFKPSAASTTLSLDPTAASLIKARPKLSIAVQQTCQTFGCFCPPFWHDMCLKSGPNGRIYFLSPSGGYGPISTSQPIPEFAERLRGIPLGDVSSEGHDDHPLRTIEEFDKILGEGAKSNLAPGLLGLFLPRK